MLRENAVVAMLGLGEKHNKRLSILNDNFMARDGNLDAGESLSGHCHGDFLLLSISVFYQGILECQLGKFQKKKVFLWHDICSACHFGSLAARPANLAVGLLPPLPF